MKAIIIIFLIWLLAVAFICRFNYVAHKKGKTHDERNWFVRYGLIDKYKSTSPENKELILALAMFLFMTIGIPLICLIFPDIV